MMELPQEHLDRFLQLLHKEISLDSFEQWVYATPDLERALTRDSYLTLLCLDYRSPHAMHIIEQVLRLHVSAGWIETRTLDRYLTAVLQRGDQHERALRWFYHRYCHGYRFLGKLGIEYGLHVSNLDPKWRGRSSNDILQERLRQFLDRNYPDIVQEAEKVQRWLREGMIVLTDDRDEMDACRWIDRRGKDS